MGSVSPQRDGSANVQNDVVNNKNISHDIDMSYMGRKLKLLLISLHCPIYSSYYIEKIPCYCLRRVHNIKTLIRTTGLIHSPLKVNNVLTFSNLSLICHPEGPRDKMQQFCLVNQFIFKCRNWVLHFDPTAVSGSTPTSPSHLDV